LNFGTVDEGQGITDPRRMSVSVLDAISSGEYRDERLYLLKTIERLEDASIKQTETIGRLKEVVDKSKTDLNDAHRKIKGLTSSSDGFGGRLTKTEIKSGYISAGVGLGLAIIFEIGKHFFHV
jgi:hypothetical protein